MMLQDLQIPVYRQPLASKEPVEVPWKDDESFMQWLANPTWYRRAFTADKDHLNSVLMSKPIEVLLSLAYLKSVRRHVHENGLSYLASFSGAHRTGKSTTACLLAHFWDPTFWDFFEQRVVQSQQQFATTMKNIIDDEITGAAVVIDEAGTTFSSVDWYEKWMKAIHKFLQTCGLLKPIILFVAPNREFIVAGMRKLIIAEHYLKRSDPKYTKMFCYHIKYNFMKKGDPYVFKRPVVKIAGQSITIKSINIMKPPSWFLERYINLTEPDKMARMSRWTDEVRQIMAEEDSAPDFDQIIEDIWSKKELFFGRIQKSGVPSIDQAQIEITYKIKPKYAKVIKERIERRLYELAKEKEELEAIAREKEEARKKEEEEERRKKMRNLPAGADIEITDEQKEKMDEELEDILSSLDEDE